MMLNDTALKLDVFEALDQAVENGYWAEARLDEEIAEDLTISSDLINCCVDFEDYADDDLMPHVADWKRLHGPR